MSDLADEIVATSKSNRQLLQAIVTNEVEGAVARLGFVRSEEVGGADPAGGRARARAGRRPSTLALLRHRLLRRPRRWRPRSAAAKKAAAKKAAAKKAPVKKAAGQEGWPPRSRPAKKTAAKKAPAKKA